LFWCFFAIMMTRFLSEIIKVVGHSTLTASRWMRSGPSEIGSVGCLRECLPEMCRGQYGCELLDYEWRGSHRLDWRVKKVGLATLPIRSWSLEASILLERRIQTFSDHKF
jgi:hypothetical protein